MSPRKSTLRDRPEIFRRSSDVEAEPEIEELDFEETSATQRTAKTKNRKTDLPKDQNTDIPQDGLTPTKKKKTSFGLPLEADIALTMLQLDEQKRTGKKPTKDELVSRAILDMAKQRNIGPKQ